MNTLKESDVVGANVMPAGQKPEIQNTLFRGGAGFKAHVNHTCFGKTVPLDFEEKCFVCDTFTPARHTFYSQRKKTQERSIPVGYGGFD